MTQEDSPLTRALPEQDMAPGTITGYHVETDLHGKTAITLTLRKGGIVPLEDLEPVVALLYLTLLQRSGPRLHAIWKPESKTLDWRTAREDAAD